MKGFKNCNIYINNKEIIKTSLTIKEGKIQSFETPKDNYLEFDDNYTVIPGFIDKHTHGVDGYKYCSASAKDMINLVKSKAKEGVTGVIATFSTLSTDATKKGIKEVVEFIKNDKLGSAIIGICLEGPYLSEEYRGGHPLEHITKGTLTHFKDLVGDNLEYIKQVAISNECCDEELLNFFKENNICVCSAHSNATYEQIKNSNVTCLTHIFSGMTPLTSADIGIVGAGLLEDDLYCEVIPDLFTVSAPALKLLYKCKGKDKICVITDSSATSHLPNGVHQVGTKEVYIKDKRATNKEGKFSGSIIWVNDGVRNLKNTLNLDLKTAVDFASKNNATALGLNNTDISVNNDANFTVVDKDLNVVLTIINGIVVYQ